MNHGGVRPGAGRPKIGKNRQLINFTLTPATVQALRHKVLPYWRSAFVEMAILDALKKVSSPPP